MDLAESCGLYLLIDAPWRPNTCFLEDASRRLEAREAARKTARIAKGRSCVFSISVVNEIPPDIVRWLGVSRVESFLNELVTEVKSVDPDRLCSFSNYPPTEYLQCPLADFVTYNVYLHDPKALDNYLSRLQMIADQRPLVIGECGIDSLSEGEGAQADILSWQIETIFRGGCAGNILFSYTDEWFQSGEDIENWAFGLTRRDRSAKPSYARVQEQFRAAPYFPLPATPSVSVIVAGYNGARTLNLCLQSLELCRYPDFEVIFVDDGSTDSTSEILSLFPWVRVVRHATNQGLSHARNTGITHARGEICAFTDADCRVDEDWLYYLVNNLLSSGFVGVGGPNYLPPEDSSVAAAVLVSPGGPTHVMLTDRLAEHIPGCNMAFYRSALVEVGCFDPLFNRAGDDVDICWRIQNRGWKIGFSPAGFVWHYRRPTIHAYLSQQYGYGEAEAKLYQKYPGNFNRAGGSIWKGRIYGPAKFGLQTRLPLIYHGAFGSGFFQTLYTAPPQLGPLIFTSFEYHLMVNLPLLTLSVVSSLFIPLALTSVMLSCAMPCVSAYQANLPPGKIRVWSRPLVALLFFLQPLVRGWARNRTRFKAYRTPRILAVQNGSLRRAFFEKCPRQLLFWSQSPNSDRIAFLGRFRLRLLDQGWDCRADEGWSQYDLEIRGSRWSKVLMNSVCEEHGQGKRLMKCRFDSHMSLSSWLMFLLFALLEIVVIVFWSLNAATLTLLGVLPLAILTALHFDQTSLRVFLNRVCKEEAVAAGFDHLDSSKTDR